MLLNYSVSQIYAMICWVFKDVSAFLFNNHVEEQAKPNLFCVFISRKYYGFLTASREISRYDLSSHSLSSVFEKVVCKYIFLGEIKSLNDYNVRDLVRYFYSYTDRKRIS